MSLQSSPAKLYATTPRAHQIDNPLSGKLNRLITIDGVQCTSIPGLSLMRTSTTNEAKPIIYQPSLYVVAQGAKQAYLGKRQYRYDALHFLVLTVPLPLQARVIKASPEQPYLAMRVELDLAEVNELARDIGLQAAPNKSEESGSGIFVSRLTSPLEDALQRLLDTLDNHQQQQILAPLIIKEALFYLLTGDARAQLSDFAQRSRASHRISTTLQHIQNCYSKPLEVGLLAEMANMSPSTYHHHFKSVTGLTPIQYLKKIRLHHAQRLMIRDGLGSSEAAYKVGYNSPSQFSREFKRFFGYPPSQEQR